MGRMAPYAIRYTIRVVAAIVLIVLAVALYYEGVFRPRHASVPTTPTTVKHAVVKKVPTAKNAAVARHRPAVHRAAAPAAVAPTTAPQPTSTPSVQAAPTTAPTIINNIYCSGATASPSTASRPSTPAPSALACPCGQNFGGRVQLPGAEVQTP